ncbi:MAG: class I SAM-dependent methyltransferase [Candidatus Paceibacterota bacterium]|jgi:ubiquinone/menaquinone biosynthesis C-methylase UbiE
MEELPKKLQPEDTKKYFSSWENIINNEDDAKLVFHVFQQALKEYGIDLVKNIKVLEIGSGNAVLLDYLRQQGVDVVGVDMKPHGNKESIQLAYIEQLPFEKESFDVILSNFVFDRLYTQNRYLMMTEIARVLKSGGIYLGREEDILIQPINGFNLISNLSEGDLKIYKKS